MRFPFQFFESIKRKSSKICLFILFLCMTANLDLPVVADSNTANNLPENSNAINDRFSSSFFRKHQLVIGRSPGLPSAVTFRAADLVDAHLRVLFLLDDELLVVPMRERGTEGLLYATFPAPERKLKYQLQAIDRLGQTVVSETFVPTVDGSGAFCSRAELEKTLGVADAYPGQADMIQQAAALEEETTLLEHVLVSLRSLAPLPREDTP